MQNVCIIWSPLLYFNFKSFLNPNSLSFIRFQWFLHNSGVLFSESWNFLKSKRGDLISGGNQLWWMSKIFGSLLYFNLKISMDPNSSSFTRFQWFLHESAEVFWFSWNFCKLKMGGTNFWGKPILQNVSIIWSPSFCISIIKVIWTEILRHSLDFSHSCINQDYFCHSPEFMGN